MSGFLAMSRASDPHRDMRAVMERGAGRPMASKKDALAVRAAGIHFREADLGRYCWECGGRDRRCQHGELRLLIQRRGGTIVPHQSAVPITNALLAVRAGERIE